VTFEFYRLSIATRMKKILTFVGFSQRKPEIPAKELKADACYLASDTLKGRKPGAKGARLAAAYIRVEVIRNEKNEVLIIQL